MEQARFPDEIRERVQNDHGALKEAIVMVESRSRARTDPEHVLVAAQRPLLIGGFLNRASHSAPAFRWWHC